jgi:hypothetical protein
LLEITKNPKAKKFLFLVIKCQKQICDINKLGIKMVNNKRSNINRMKWIPDPPKESVFFDMEMKLDSISFTLPSSFPT